MPKFRFDDIQDIAGFAAATIPSEHSGWIQTRGSLTSDEDDFYRFVDQLANILLGKTGVPLDTVAAFLALRHEGGSTDVYVNEEVPVSLEIKAKTNLKAGGIVRASDIADIRSVDFPGISILPTDKLVFCFRYGWRFGLFFDLDLRNSATQDVPGRELDIDGARRAIAGLYRKLAFFHVYKVIEQEAAFQKLLDAGWFPFVELLARDYEDLSRAFAEEGVVTDLVSEVMDRFGPDRVAAITEKWWGNQNFAAKRPIIQAGVDAYIQGTDAGLVNCIKNLSTEIEGILRSLYQADLPAGARVTPERLMHEIVARVTASTGTGDSLLLPEAFLLYIRDVIFAHFDAAAGRVPMSRNASSHGVAEPHQYTRERALQLILTLDQIYFSTEGQTTN